MLTRIEDNRNRTGSKTLNEMWIVTAVALYSLSKKTPTLVSCSFDKHGVILIIFGKQYQHTFKNDMHIQFSWSLHFYLFYLLLDSCDGNDAKPRVFLGRLFGGSENSRLCNVLALKRAGFSLAHVQCHVLLPPCMHTTASHFLHWPIASTFCDMFAHVMCCVKSLLSRTCVLYNGGFVSCWRTCFRSASW